MLNEDKIRLMTQISIYEKEKGKEFISIGKYHKKDYVVLKMLHTAVAAAVAYVCILGIWVLGQLATILENLNKMDFVSLGIKLVIGFALMEAVFVAISFVIYSKRYNRATKSLKVYYNNLKRLSNF